MKQMNVYKEAKGKKYIFGIGIVSFVMVCVFLISYFYWKDNSTLDSMATNDEALLYRYTV